jgi:23S rRNA pseudouridine1911/1915/1917 synthase
VSPPAPIGVRIFFGLSVDVDRFHRCKTRIKDGRVRVNGAAERPARLLREGDCIEIEPAELPALRAVLEAIPLRILYEDDD